MAYWKCQECDALNLYPEVNKCDTCGHIITKDETVTAMKAIAEEKARRREELCRKLEEDARIKAEAERRKEEVKHKAEEQRIRREEEERIEAVKESRKQAEETMQKEKAKRRKKRKWIIGLVVAIILVVAEVLLLTFDQTKYGKAIALIGNNDYCEAYNMFAELGNYKDSKEQLADTKNSMKTEDYQTILKNLSIGDYFFFGAYELDNDNSNGKEEISWKVLAKDNDRILVISKYCLDCQNYNDKYEYVTWETCSIREWLNDSFYEAAFCEQQQAAIINSTLSNPDNPICGTEGGITTEDKVFLLSYEEVQKYFYSNKEMKARPTKYAEAQGINKYHGKSIWCLRSPGNKSTCIMTVNALGGIYVESNNDVNCNGGGIRPAIWISIDS